MSQSKILDKGVQTSIIGLENLGKENSDFPVRSLFSDEIEAGSFEEPLEYPAERGICHMAKFEDLPMGNHHEHLFRDTVLIRFQREKENRQKHEHTIEKKPPQCFKSDDFVSNIHTGRRKNLNDSYFGIIKAKTSVLKEIFEPQKPKERGNNCQEQNNIPSRISKRMSYKMNRLTSSPLYSPIKAIAINFTDNGFNPLKKKMRRKCAVNKENFDGKKNAVSTKSTTKKTVSSGKKKKPSAMLETNTLRKRAIKKTSKLVKLQKTMKKCLCNDKARSNGRLRKQKQGGK